MEARFELDPRRDVAYIHMDIYDPWRYLVRQDWVVDFDTDGRVVGLQVSHAHQRLSDLGIALP